jgi:gluconolactonase
MAVSVWGVFWSGFLRENFPPFFYIFGDDGFRCDVDGNLWCGWGMGNAQQDGVKIFDPAGKPIGFIALPERCANLCFGGAKRNRLFMATSHSLYSLYVITQGAPGG